MDGVFRVEQKMGDSRGDEAWDETYYNHQRVDDWEPDFGQQQVAQKNHPNQKYCNHRCDPFFRKRKREIISQTDATKNSYH